MIILAAVYARRARALITHGQVAERRNRESLGGHGLGYVTSEAGPKGNETPIRCQVITADRRVVEVKPGL